MIYHGSVGDADLPDDMCRSWQSRQDHEKDGPHHPIDDVKEGRGRVEQSSDAGKDRGLERGRPKGREEEIREDVLVNIFRLDLLTLSLRLAEENTGNHAITIEPVRIPTEVFVGDGISAVADVLATEKLGGDGACVGAWG